MQKDVFIYNTLSVARLMAWMGWEGSGGVPSAADGEMRFGKKQLFAFFISSLPQLDLLV